MVNQKAEAGGCGDSQVAAQALREGQRLEIKKAAGKKGRGKGRKEGRREGGKEGRKEAIRVLSWQIFSSAGFQSLRLQPEVEAASGSNEPPSQKPDKAATDAGSVFKWLGGAEG